MYDFVDRPISEQRDAVQFFVLAMRRCVKAAVDRQCACHVIGSSFAACNLAQAAAPFHALMRTLCANARVPLRIGAIDHEAITEHEALMITAVVAATQGRERDLRAIARGLVFADLAPALAASLATLAARFAGADVLFEPKP